MVALPGAGHMLMSERPDETLAALRAAFGPAESRTHRERS
jgi:pimeloyl-ACP methyl ester carboxylesterase